MIYSHSACVLLILQIRLEVLTYCFTWQSIELNKLAISVRDFSPKNPQHASLSEIHVAYTIAFSREPAREIHVHSLPSSSTTNPRSLLFKALKSNPPTNYPKHWDVKTFVVAIPIVYPQVEPILGELTQQGFDCFVCSSMENPLCPMRMFSLVFLRRGVKYPTLDCTPFQGTASFRPLKYTAAAVYRQYLGSIVWDLFTCCWYWVRLSVSRDADFMRRGAFLVPPPQTCPCCYIHIF